MDVQAGDANAQRRSAVILRILRSIGTARSIRQLITLLARETRIVLNCQRASVFLYDPDEEELWSLVAEGESDEIRFPADSGIAGHVFESGRALVTDDVPTDPRFNPEIDARTGFTTRQLLTAPIIGPGGEKVGVFQLVNQLQGGFDSGDVEFLEAIAGEAAVTIQNFQMLESRRRMFEGLVNALAESIESRDPLTAGHSYQVMLYSVETAREMGLDSGQIETIRYAALLHDYGKIGIPDSILKKDGALSDGEREIIRTHVEHTEKILSRIEFERGLRDVPRFAVEHHERLDGSGYPRGLSGEDISLGGRIIAVADVFESLTSQRHYRSPMPHSRAMAVIREGAGGRFDPEVVDAFGRVMVRLGRTEETDTVG
jgi:HD-GYP domain-containing protein (c-di-GMP phosphodiesterase class II)